MAKTGDVTEENQGNASTGFAFVLYDRGGQARATFAYATLVEARRGKELIDMALAKATGELWP